MNGHPSLGTAEIIKANALDLPLADESVDLIVTSPPYFALRSYRDGDEHYDGQIGSEDTPQQFLEALWAVMAECWRVLKPSGSCFVNLGDKYAGSGGHNNSNIGAPKERGPSSYNKQASFEADRRGIGAKAMREDAGLRRLKPSEAGVPAKSLMGLPWRFAIGCIDGMAAPNGEQWILRAEVIWDKPNGLPESVTDRVRRSHEQWFHFVKSPRYFAAVDEVREAYSPATAQRYEAGYNGPRPASSAGQTANGVIRLDGGGPKATNPLGKLPGSVWRIATEPLKVPAELGIDHFAAFPTEWPRRIILGWSPSGICSECGDGRRPVVKREFYGEYNAAEALRQQERAAMSGGVAKVTLGQTDNIERTITGYACACPEPTAPTKPAVVLDPFGGTGTTALVAKALGRRGISVDLSADYCRLAEWRTNDEKSIAKVRAKTYGEALRKRPRQKPLVGQTALFVINGE